METCALSRAVWISPDPSCASPVIRRRFEVRGETRGRLEITGLGYFTASMNGRPVSADRFVPALSDVEKRTLAGLAYPIHDELTHHRTYYLSYDVSALLREGENLLEIQLADGFYRQNERVCEGRLSFGDRLRALYALTLSGGQASSAGEAGSREILSDGSEDWRSSEITRSALYIGETQDARLLGREPVWKPVDVLPAPESELCLQTCPPDRLIRVLHPVRLGEREGRVIYDAGENVSGVVRIRGRGAAGEVIRLRFAEVLRDGAPDFHSTGSDYVCGESGQPQIMTDTFICDGQDRRFEPRFVWHAFRYFDVEGPGEEPEVLVIHSDVPVTSAFESGSEGMNWLYGAFLRTQLNNMHGGVPSDCPHRERLGYTGDGQACAPAVMLMTDSREFYRKWIRDILDCQDREGGHIQHTAPFMGGGGGPGGWGCAVVLVPYAYWKQYGETDMLRESYGGMKKWAGYLSRKCENGLVVKEEDGGWCLGDWCTLGEVRIPAPLVNTCFFIRILDLMAEIAGLLGCGEDAPGFRRHAAELRGAVEREYYDPATGDFCGGVQGSNAYGLWVGLGDGRTADRLAAKYDALGHMDTGFLGTDILLEQLFRTGHARTAYRLLDGDQPGTFLHMKRQGATTVWETWEGGASHDHPMFGACSRLFFQWVLGIRQPEGSAGYEKVIIDPAFDPEVGFAEGSIETPKGRIYVRWEYVDGKPVVESRVQFYRA